VTVRWLSSAPPRLTWQIDRFQEGTVYRFWCAWLFVKVRVKA